MAYPPESVQAYLTPDQFYLYRLIWNRFVASQMMPRLVRRHDGGHRRRPATSSAPKERCRSSPGWLAVYGQGSGEAEESERTEQPATPGASPADSEEGAQDDVLPPLVGGADAGTARARARAEVHAAASALQRRVAGEGARRGRHRPPEHLRVDHLRAAGARVREQDRRQVQADDSRPAAGRQAAASGVRRHPRRRVHRAHGGPARRDREGQGRLQGNAGGVLQGLQEGPEARGQGNAQLQGRAADRTDLRQMRPRARWWRRPAGSASSWRAAVIPIATTRRNWSRPRRRRRRSRRTARTAAGRWS